MRKELRRPRVLILDFDFTIAHFGGSFDGLFDIFIRRGVPRSLVHAAHAKAEAAGFSIAQFTKFAQEVFPAFNGNEADIYNEFHDWLSTTLRPYQDAMSVIERWALAFPLVIVTAGDPDYQREKVASLTIPHQDFAVTKHGAKHIVIAELLKKYGTPAVFIEDNPHELDILRDVGIGSDRVCTVRIRRPDSPHNSVSSRHSHIEVATLDEVEQFFPHLAPQRGGEDESETGRG